MRYFIRLQYHGLPFNGWQIQPNAPSVQGTLTQALIHILGEPVQVVGAGRTDTGVHASMMVAHFDVSNPIEDREHVLFRLNRYLNGPIVINEIIPVGDEDHARFSAVERGYRYRLSREWSPFNRDLVWTYTKPLNREAMQQASTYLLDVEDFSSFARTGSDVKHHRCDVRFAQWHDAGAEWVFEIRADRFLRNMVRSIVGTLVDVGAEKLSLEGFKQVVERKSRSEAGTSAPAQGLYLSRVKYPEHIEKQWKNNRYGE